MPQRRVLVFRKDLLPVSETFIPAQIAACRRWTPLLAGFQRVPGIDVDALAPDLLFDPARAADRLALRRDQFLPYLGTPGRRTLRLVRALAPDLVHAHFGYDAVLVADAARACRIPLLVTLHGTDVLRDWRGWASGDDGLFFRFYPRKMQALFRDPHVHFIAVSEALRQAAIRQGAPAERLHLAYTGIDTARFAAVQRSAQAPPTILFVGRLVAFKGCEILIRAMAQVRRTVPEARLVVAGEGPLRAELEALAASLGVAASFVGRVDQPRVAELLGQATAFCLPSLTEADGVFEAFGMVMLEAQAAGVPVVTSAKAGAEAVVDGETGHVFAERDVAGLAAILARLCADTGQAARLGSAARAHVRARFDVRDCTRVVEDLYDRVAREAAYG